MAKPKPKKRKPAVPSDIIRHGGRDLKIPKLSGPVGPESAVLRARYPAMNQPTDLEVVDYYLSAIEAVKGLNAREFPNEMAAQRLLGVVQKNIPWEDRTAAIKILQTDLAEIRDQVEKRDTLVLPGGDTLRALVDLGDVAEHLLNGGDGASKYIHAGTFDRVRFSRGFSSHFPRHKVNTSLLQLLGFMERDPYVFDIRWMAYMFATASIETGWAFTPVDERGQGKLGKYKKGALKGQWNIKDYYLPVRVKRLPDGRASITEWDGDVFTVAADGTISGSALSKRGAEAVNRKTQTFIPAVPSYASAGGEERKYFGRGYCQLTWWNTYVSAGIFMGRGLDFLYDPDLVSQPEVAYQIMSAGMRTGQMFANGMRISRFICGSHCDYPHARQMVNGMNNADEIAEIAVKFESILLASKHALLAEGPS